jgi:general secretion pathway protein A
MEYLKFYEIEIEPFQNEPDERFYFESSAHRRAHMRLLRGVTQRKGLGVLIGGAGCGKTTLAHHLHCALESEKWATRVLTITHADCVSGWLLPEVAKAFGVLAPAGTGPELLAQIEAQLGSIVAQGRHPTLLVDEAQILSSAAVMEEFRGLLNLNREGKKLISLVLYGLEDLAQVLELDAPLAQRVEIRVELLRLPKEEVGRYVQHRLKSAGAQRELFTSDAIEALAAYSNGVPRLINTLADNALFEGYLSELDRVDGSVVAQAAEDLGLSTASDTGENGAPGWVESIVPEAETDFSNSIALEETESVAPVESAAQPAPEVLVAETPDLGPAPDYGSTLRREVALPAIDPTNELTQIADLSELESGFSMGSIVRDLDPSDDDEEEHAAMPEPAPGVEVELSLEFEEQPGAAESSTPEDAVPATIVVDAAYHDAEAAPQPPDGESSFVLEDPVDESAASDWSPTEDAAVPVAEPSSELAAPQPVVEEAPELEIEVHSDPVELDALAEPDAPALFAVDDEDEEEPFIGGEDSISGAQFEPSSMFQEEPELEAEATPDGEDSINGAEFEASDVFGDELETEASPPADEAIVEADLDLASAVDEDSPAEAEAFALDEDGNGADPAEHDPVALFDDAPEAIAAAEESAEEDFDPSSLIEEEPEPVALEADSTEDGEFDPSILIEEEAAAEPVAVEASDVDDGEFDPSSLLDEDDELENLFEQIQVDA